MRSPALLAITESLDALTRGPDLSRYLYVCTGLLAAILVLAWGFRRLVADRLKLRAARRSLAVIDVLPLGGRRQLSVVRCYDRTFVLGLGEKEVALITELDAAIGSERADPATPPKAPADFAQLFERAGNEVTPAAAAGLARRRSAAPSLGEVVG